MSAVLATCGCKGRPTWRTTVVTNADLLDPRPPFLPLTATTPCPACGATERLVHVQGATPP